MITLFVHEDNQVLCSRMPPLKCLQGDLRKRPAETFTSLERQVTISVQSYHFSPKNSDSTEYCDGGPVVAPGA